MSANLQAASTKPSLNAATLPILFALSGAHFLNDLVQSLLPAIYPLLKDELALDFTQIGLITFTFQVTASLLQPLVGLYTDRKPKPYSLAVGMLCSLVGLLLLASASNFGLVLLAAGVIGTGSSIFHPESSRVARLASGGRHGFAQSLFQVGGNTGQAIGPLLVVIIVMPRGQASLAWFAIATLVGFAVLWKVGAWYKQRIPKKKAGGPAAPLTIAMSRPKIVWSIVILLLLVFSKNFYIASLTSYYTFYAIHKFGVSVETSQILLFLFMATIAAGTFLGGPIGDRFGRRPVMWVSILGALPFSLALPYAGLWGTIGLTIAVGFIMASAFPTIVVYAQELMPGRVGMVAGLFFGFAFGIGGLGAALLGVLADHTSIEYVYLVCSFLPAIGILMWFLPKMPREAAG
jgi:FSR family fosmidomycin resistance protein-like MFS transporter